MGGFFDAPKHTQGLKSLLVAGTALFANGAADEVGQKVDHAVDQITERLSRRLLTLMVASLLSVAGMGLLATALGLLIAPYVGAAGAVAIIGTLVLAAGGGLFLHLRQKRV